MFTKNCYTHNKVLNWRYTISFRSIGLIIAAIVLIIGGSIAFLIINREQEVVTYISVPPEEEEIVYGRGDMLGNSLGHTLVVERDGYVYVTVQIGDYSRLYRIPNEGSAAERQQIGDDKFGNTSSINVVGDWIYYVHRTTPQIQSIYRLSRDGSRREHISEDRSTGLTVVDGWVYYINLSDNQIGTAISPIYRMRTNGSLRERITESYVHRFIITDGGWIYYSINNDYGMYRIRTDGTERLWISDYHIVSIAYYDNWIFYRSIFPERNIYKVSADTTESILIYEQAEGMRLSDGYIYFSPLDEGRRSNNIHRISLEGTLVDTIYIEDLEFFSVVGGWIYFTTYFLPLNPTHRLNISTREIESLIN